MQQGLTENLVTLGINTVMVYQCYNLSEYFKVFNRGVWEHSDCTNGAIDGWP